MKLRTLLLATALGAALAVIGCGDDGGSNGGNGGGTCDPDIICANCEGPQLNDCRADVVACDLDPRGCEACIEATDPGC